MPKIICSLEEFETAKTDNLQSVLNLMCDDRFGPLSIRKLTARLKTTAAKIYKCYKNKDDMYRTSRTRGFRIPLDRLKFINASQAGESV